MSKCFNGTKINDSYNEPYIDMAVNKAVGQQEMPKDKDEALQQFLGEYDPRNAEKTQIKQTIETYKKAHEKYFKNVPGNQVLDFGAGLGMGSDMFGYDSYEPFPERGREMFGFNPNYTELNQIDKEYKGLVSNAVLNVIPNVNGERDAAVRGIGKALAPGGKAFISVRNPGFMKQLKNPQKYGDGVVTSSNTFQKGFTRGELVKYLSKILGPSFRIEPSNIGDVGVLITRKRSKSNDFISESDAIRRSSVKTSPREGGLVLKDTQMTTPLDNFSRGNRDTRQVHNMLSENFILHRINKDGSITAFLEIDNGKYKVIKGLRTFEDVAREIGIPNPYEESPY